MLFGLRFNPHICESQVQLTLFFHGCQIWPRDLGEKKKIWNWTRRKRKTYFLQKMFARFKMKLFLLWEENLKQKWTTFYDEIGLLLRYQMKPEFFCCCELYFFFAKEKTLLEFVLYLSKHATRNRKRKERFLHQVLNC